MVRHFRRAMRNTPLQEGSVQLLLRLGRLGSLNDGLVSNGSNVVCLVNHGNFVLVLDDSRDLNGLLDGIKVLVPELEEGDIVRNLVGNGENGRLGVLLGQMGEGDADLVCELDFVDVVLAQGVVNAQREAGPHDLIGVDGRDEERQLIGLDVVGELAVGAVAAAQVVEVAALPTRVMRSQFQVLRGWSQDYKQFLQCSRRTC